LIETNNISFAPIYLAALPAQREMPVLVMCKAGGALFIRFVINLPIADKPRLISGYSNWAVGWMIE
jgi:hypothetical protein